jgi:hypothetical protein
MRFRKLRIAWSVGCGVVCLLTIALWVRSYWYWDGIVFTGYSMHLGIDSDRGRVLPYYQSNPRASYGWLYYSNDIERAVPQDTHKTFSYVRYPGYFSTCIPNWFIAAVAATLATTPWLTCLPWSNRFSLRTLLIVITLAALALGTIIATTR